MHTATFCSQGRYPEAELLFRQAQDINEKVYGPENLEVAIDLNNRAGLMESQVRAVRYFQENLVVHCGCLSPQQPGGGS